MRIVVVNTAASSGGALSILRDFYEYIKISEIKDKHEWVFLLSDNYIEETENIKVIIKKEPKSNWRNRLKWEVKEGASFINELKPDVVFSMQNTINKGLNSPTMIYLHQAIPFQNVKKFSFFKREERLLAIYQYIIGVIIKSSLKRADKVVVQTRWMKEAVTRAIKTEKTKVIIASPKIQEDIHYLKANYSKVNKFFYPAGTGIYKNHKIIVEATERLINEGITDFIIDFTLEEEYKQQLGISKDTEKNIRLIGHISRDEVFNRYKDSVLLFPSYIETFGLPLLEARIVNSFIISSECEFAKEVLDGYKNVTYFNPFSVEQLVEQMKKVIIEDVELEKEDYSHMQNNGWEDVIMNLEQLNL